MGEHKARKIAEDTIIWQDNTLIRDATLRRWATIVGLTLIVSIAVIGGYYSVFNNVQKARPVDDKTVINKTDQILQNSIQTLKEKAAKNTGTQSSKDADLNALAYAYYQAKNYDEAIKILQPIAENGTTDAKASALLLLATIYTENKPSLDLAKKYLQLWIMGYAKTSEPTVTTYNQQWLELLQSGRLKKPDIGSDQCAREIQC